VSSDRVPLEVHEADCIAFSHPAFSGGHELSVGFANGTYSFTVTTRPGDPSSFEEDLPVLGQSRLLFDVLQNVAPLARTYRFGNGPRLFAPPGARCNAYTVESDAVVHGGIVCTALPYFDRSEEVYRPSKPTLDVDLTFECPVMSD
jgi:hypothetical protein